MLSDKSRKGNCAGKQKSTREWHTKWVVHSDHHKSQVQNSPMLEQIQGMFTEFHRSFSIVSIPFIEQEATAVLKVTPKPFGAN